jgi:Flp pilus assembly protein TadD
MTLIVLTLALLVAGPSALAQKKPTQEAASGEIAETHLGKGYDALRQDRYEIAAEEFRAALKLDPSLVEKARFPLAVALFEMHKPDEARRELEAVRAAVGDHPNVLYYLGRLDIEDGKFESAIDHLNRAAQKPPFPDTAYYLGYAYLKQGDLAAAEKWLTEAAKVNPQESRTQYQLGLLYRKTGREEEAKEAIARSDELRRRDSEMSQVRLECGQKLEHGPRDEAHAVCDQLYDPDNADRLTALGTLYAQHADVQSALKPLQRAAELAPESPQMQYNLALAYYQLHQFAEARGPLATAIARWPDIFQINALYGAVLMELGEDGLAHETLRHAHELNPEDPATARLLYMTALGLGTKSQTAGLYQDAVRYLKEAATLQPLEPDPHRAMAEIYARTGRPTEARKERERADHLGNQKPH